MNGSELSPLQAGLRFLIEIVALCCWGIVGRQLSDGAAGWILAFVLPTAAATLWGTFRAPDDHSAGGTSPVPVPGFVRLGIELVVLLGGAIATAIVWRPVVGIVIAVVVVGHYVATLPRVGWLLAQRAS